MKKALFISYFFPPSGESGMWRSLKFVRHLPEYGWRPIVLTIREQCYYMNRIDYTSLEEIPELTNVYRTKMVHLVPTFGKIVSGLLRKKADKHTTSEKSADTASSNGNGYSKSKKLLMDALTTPDRYSGWLPFAVIEGLRVALREKPDVIFSTSPPESSHMVALTLKSILNIPWVADFRDPWIKPTTNTDTDPGGLKQFLNPHMEKAIMRRADIVIGNTPPLSQHYATKYDGIAPPDKFATVTNGYAIGDLQPFEGRTIGNGKFTITHTGEFYEYLRAPDNFMIALSRLVSEGKISRDEVKVNFVGGGDYTKSTKFGELLGRLGLSEVINSIDFVPHKQCIEFLYGSTTLLLLQPTPQFNLQIPAKAFEYIGIGKPILAITPGDGATAQLIKNTQTGVIVPQDNLESISNEIFHLYQEYKKGELGKYRNEQARSDYSRKELTRELSGLLNRAAL